MQRKICCIVSAVYKFFNEETNVLPVSWFHSTCKNPVFLSPSVNAICSLKHTVEYICILVEFFIPTSVSNGGKLLYFCFKLYSVVSCVCICLTLFLLLPLSNLNLNRILMVILWCRYQGYKKPPLSLCAWIPQELIFFQEVYLRQ